MAFPFPSSLVSKIANFTLAGRHALLRRAERPLMHQHEATARHCFVQLVKKHTENHTVSRVSRCWHMSC
ncbi:hypothetical protein [Propionivibrio limicola]|uniref:hypothetical protein n=1 Tax=Propionivibrio limicola TaxID=167645 RepID=UPI0012924E32|nr:hypothetical protein [Propionivibrio limicola]